MFHKISRHKIGTVSDPQIIHFNKSNPSEASIFYNSTTYQYVLCSTSQEQILFLFLLPNGSGFVWPVTRLIGPMRGRGPKTQREREIW